MDRPLYGKGKSSLVGIWDHLLFLNMKGKKIDNFSQYFK